MYDVVVITNRNYGLYMGFSTQILSLSTLIIVVDVISENEEVKIWQGETLEDYYYGVHKLNIDIKIINKKHFFVGKKDDNIEIQYKEEEKFYTIPTKNVIYAMSDDNSIILNKMINNIGDDAFEMEKNHYIIGEKATYNSKIFSLPFYIGECVILAGIIYKEIRHIDNLETSYSTNLMV